MKRLALNVCVGFIALGFVACDKSKDLSKVSNKADSSKVAESQSVESTSTESNQIESRNLDSIDSTRHTERSEVSTTSDIESQRLDSTTIEYNQVETQLKNDAKSATQTILSLDVVLENLINKAMLDSINNLTQEECEKLPYSANLQDSQNNDEAYNEEQSCYYAMIQNLKSTIAELIANKHIATDTHSLDSILRYKIIAFLSAQDLQSLRDVLGFEAPYALQAISNVCHRIDGLVFEASCNLYMQIFDELARYVAQEQKLPQKAMHDYQSTFEQITQSALDRIDQELPDMP